MVYGGIFIVLRYFVISLLIRRLRKERGFVFCIIYSILRFIMKNLGVYGNIGY